MSPDADDGTGIGVLDSACGSTLFEPPWVVPLTNILLRLASRRLSTLAVVLSSGSSLIARGDRCCSTLLSRFVRSKAVSLLGDRILALATSPLDLSVDKAMHSSVRLRHILSAFRFSCLSILLEVTPDDPLLVVILTRERASNAVASKAEYTCMLK